MKQALNYLIYVVVRILFCTVQALRIETCHAIIRPMAWILADVLRIRADVVDDNLRHAFPAWSPAKRQAIARRQWEHLLLMIVEIAHTPRKIHLTNWRDHVRFHNKRELVGRLLDDRPCVLLSGHFGSFEVGGQVVGLFGFPTFTIARPLDNPFLDRFFNSFRTRNGQRVLPKKGIADEAAHLLSDGRAMVILGDQSAGPKGCWVDFFGRPASTHKAIALFSLTGDAPMMVNYTLRLAKPMQFEVGCEATADPRDGTAPCTGVRELTAWYTQRLEDLVRRNPEQYWWLHRRWKEYPGQRLRHPNPKRAA